MGGFRKLKLGKAEKGISSQPAHFSHLCYFPMDSCVNYPTVFSQLLHMYELFYCKEAIITIMLSLNHVLIQF